MNNNLYSFLSKNKDWSKYKEKEIDKILKMIFKKDRNIPESFRNVDGETIINDFINQELSYTDDVYDNIFQITKLYCFFDIIDDENQIINIFTNIINNNEKLFKILKNIVKDNESLLNDDRLMILIDAFSIVSEDEIDDSDNKLKNYHEEIKALPKLSEEQRTFLLKKAKNGDRQARDKFIEGNLRLVYSIAKNYRLCAEYDDIVSCGKIGLVEAYEKFNIDLGYRFSTYAIEWIRREILVYLNQNNVLRVPHNKASLMIKIRRLRERFINEGIDYSTKNIAKELNISEEDVQTLLNVPTYAESIYLPLLNDDDSDELVNFLASDVDIEEDIMKNMTKSEIADIFKEMLDTKFINPREAKVVLMRNGFFNDKVYTYIEIGKELKITKQRVDQIYKKFFSKLRHSKYIYKFAACLDDERVKSKYISKRRITSKN